jgi:hypothetical protein
MTDPFDYDALDPGVRAIVRTLRALGFVTTDSGDGVSKPPAWYQPDAQGLTEALDVAHVVCQVDRATFFAEADRLAAVVKRFGTCGIAWVVEATYNAPDGPYLLLARARSPEELELVRSSGGLT